MFLYNRKGDRISKLVQEEVQESLNKLVSAEMDRRSSRSGRGKLDNQERGEILEDFMLRFSMYPVQALQAAMGAWKPSVSKPAVNRNNVQPSNSGGRRRKSGSQKQQTSVEVPMLKITRDVVTAVLTEVAMQLPEEASFQFSLEQMSAFMPQIQEKLGAEGIILSDERVEEFGAEAKFFPPIEEIRRHREGDVVSGVSISNNDAVTVGEIVSDAAVSTNEAAAEGKAGADNFEEPEDPADDQSRIHKAAVDFVGNLFHRVSQIPEIRLEDAWRRVQRIDSALKRVEFDALVGRAQKGEIGGGASGIPSTHSVQAAVAQEPRTSIKESPDTVQHSRFFFAVSGRYRNEVDEAIQRRQKIVSRALGSTFELPTSAQDREDAMNDLRTTLRTAELPSTNWVIHQDMACLRIAFLNYCGTEAVQLAVGGMIMEEHPATHPLRILLEDGYTAWEDFGYQSKPLLSAKQELVALEYLGTVAKLFEQPTVEVEDLQVPVTVRTDSKGAQSMKNFLRNSPSFVTGTKTKTLVRYDAIFPVLWPKFMKDGNVTAGEAMEILKDKKIKAAKKTDLTNDLPAFRTVYQYYHVDGEKKAALAKSKDDKNAAGGILRRLLADGLDTWDKLLAGSAQASGEEAPAPKPGRKGGSRDSGGAAVQTEAGGDTTGTTPFPKSVAAFVAANLPSDFEGKAIKGGKAMKALAKKFHGKNISLATARLAVADVLKDRAKVKSLQRPVPQELQPATSAPIALPVFLPVAPDPNPAPSPTAKGNLTPAPRFDVNQYEFPKGTAGKTLRNIAARIDLVQKQIDEYNAKIREASGTIFELEEDFNTRYRASQLDDKYSE